MAQHVAGGRTARNQHASLRHRAEILRVGADLDVDFSSDGADLDVDCSSDDEESVDWSEQPQSPSESQNDDDTDGESPDSPDAPRLHEDGAKTVPVSVVMEMLVDLARQGTSFLTSIVKSIIVSGAVTSLAPGATPGNKLLQALTPPRTAVSIRRAEFGLQSLSFYIKVDTSKCQHDASNFAGLSRGNVVFATTMMEADETFYCVLDTSDAGDTSAKRTHGDISKQWRKYTYVFLHPKGRRRTDVPAIFLINHSATDNNVDVKELPHEHDLETAEYYAFAVTLKTRVAIGNELLMDY